MPHSKDADDALIIVELVDDPVRTHAK